MTNIDSGSMEPAQWWGIADVAAWCGDIAAHSMMLFEWCGQQARSTEDGGWARWCATASHRHAWHVELARERMPTIPLIDSDSMVMTATNRVAALHLDGDTNWSGLTADLRLRLADAALGNNPLSDPSTERTRALIEHDLSDLAATLPGAPT